MKTLAKIFFAVFVFGQFTSCTEESNPYDNPVVTTIPADKVKIENNSPKTALENQIKSIDNEDLNFDDYDTESEYLIFASMYAGYAININKYKISKNDTLKKLALKLESIVKKAQIKNFPKARKAYYTWAKNKLWEEDIEVQLGGKSNEILTFIAGMFASNKEIKAAEETLHTMFVMLRFKQVRYKWYKGDDEYTYYKIESPKDSEIKEAE